MPQREVSAQSAEDSRFPGAGRTLGSSQGQMASGIQSNSNLQARPLEDSSPNQPSEGRHAVDNAATAAAGVPHHQAAAVSEEEIKKLVAMGFDRTQVEVALAAADGDLNVAVEILMSQQG
uniref:UBA domain-containing protein n=1 Tax=Lotus japonicus TaxID=34305 RepID=I3T571_LOTJA|nr:unknown [Lotus japonicus]